MNAIVIDCETSRAILKRGEQPEINPVTLLPYIYTDSFDDHTNAPAVTGVWDCAAGYPPQRFYFQEQLHLLAKEIEQRRWVVSFNGISFDAPKLALVGVDIPAWKHFDLAVALREASGEYVSLDALAVANLGSRKNGSGKDSPLMWQRYQADPTRVGDLWTLLGYVMSDCWITWRLLMRVVKHGELLHPKLGQKVKVELPEGFV